MPFAEGTRNRVLLALEMPVVDLTADLGNANNYIDRVQRALNQAETNGGQDMVTRIEGLLDSYEAQLAAYSESVQSGQGALIKADVLEWAPGQISSSQKGEYLRVRQQLARLLGLDKLSGGGSRVRVVRA
ncbi:MAG: hypothetical protein ACR2FS_04650 [Phormidesmis sp.]